MYILRLVIRNLRGIRSADIRLSDGANIIVGRNGSGKSTVCFAIRLLLDTAMSSQQRNLDEGDIYGNDAYTLPANVVVAAQLGGYDESNPADNAQRLDFMVNEADQASLWIVYRYRPSLATRTKLLDGELALPDLRQSHYTYERYVGVNTDPHTMDWDDTVKATVLTDQHLADIHITEIPALRDVVSALRNERTSPLARLVDTYEVSEDDRSTVVAAYAGAQKVVEAVKQFADLALDVRQTYDRLAQEVPLAMRLATTAPKYSAIVRSLGILLTDDLIVDMELRRNGLGINNLLFIAILLRTYERSKKDDRGSRIMLIEEPEAHLHPQAQCGLMTSLFERSFQTVVTTHSAYVAMSGGLERVINLDRDDEFKGINIAKATEVTKRELRDLDRYLKIDRGTILFASVVILVEGPSEQTLLTAYAAAQGIDLSRRGIQVCAINGVHFSVYEKLLGSRGLRRPNISVRDGDQQNKGMNYDDGTNVATIAGQFMTRTTLECALAQANALPALIATMEDFKKAACVNALQGALHNGTVTVELQRQVLAAAADIGKYRFAQRLADEIEERKLAPPQYIGDALIEAVKLQQDSDLANGGVDALANA